MRINRKIICTVIAVGTFGLYTPHALKAQGRRGGAPAEEESGTTKTIKKTADALGMLRSINRIDAINTMEWWANGTSTINGAAAPTDYHVMMGYNPPGMRVDMVRTVNGAKQEMITEVTDKYSWNESQIGGGLTPGKGTATPDMGAMKERYLAMWIFPFGAVKAALAASAKDMAKVSTANGTTVITFPLMGPLEGVTETVTLDAKDMPAKVETKGDSPMLNTVTQYSDYKDRGDISSDVMYPGTMVEMRDGKPYLNLKITKDDPNNPYLIFPVPDSVRSAQ